MAGDEELVRVRYTTAATAASPVGNYPIKVHFDDPEGRLDNYNVIIHSAFVTVVDELLRRSSIPTWARSSRPAGSPSGSGGW